MGGSDCTISGWDRFMLTSSAVSVSRHKPMRDDLAG